MQLISLKEFVESSVVIYSKSKPSDLPAVMLWGQPGVGKSDSFKEIGRRLHELTGKTVNFVDIRLLLYSPVDLKGIPTADEMKRFTKWLTPQIFNLDASDNVINIIVLDEINAAVPTTQACAYQITLDRKVGEAIIPDNTIIFLAGNRMTDKAVTYKMPKPLGNRATHFEVTVDFDSWKEWAIRNGIDQRIISFLSFRPGLLNTFDPKNEDVVFATPRSWAMCSSYLKNLPWNMAKTYIAGTVGEGVAVEFFAYCEIYTKVPKIIDIANGVYTTPHTEPDICYAISTGITVSVAKMNDKQLENTLLYTRKLPPEFTTMICRDLLNNIALIPNVVKLKAWKEWIKDFNETYAKR